MGATSVEADTVSCPKCGGAMWDNRISKRNPKAPDFKCRLKSCDGVIWPPRPGEGSTVAPPVTASEDTEVQCMIDLETMSTLPNAAICSIGAVKFTLASGIVDTFYTTIDLASTKAAGLHIQKETVQWWSKQNPKALEMLRVDNVSLEEAVDNFLTWFGPKSMKVWGNGAAFDDVILREAIRAVGKKAPWHYRDEMCYRTVCRLIRIAEPKREGTYHNALDDAKHQTKHLITLLSS